MRALASHQCGSSSYPDVDAICGLSLLLVLSFAPRGFSPGTPVFPCPQQPSISKFQFAQESGRRRTTLWMCYLHIVIYLFIYLFINYNQVGCVNKLYDVNAWQPLKATSQQTAVSRFSLVCQLLITKHKLIFKISRTLQAKCSKRYTDLQS